MLYFNRNGVWFKIPIKQNGVYSRELLEKQIHSSLLGLQNLKDRSPDIDQMRFEKPGEYVVNSIFGKDEITINPKVLIEEDKKKIKLPLEWPQYIPAIEAYDIAGVFVGIVLCLSGTFEPPYLFVTVDSDSIDPFLWGQWVVYFDPKPYTIRKERIIKFIPEEVFRRKLTDIPCTNEFVGDFEWGDPDTTISSEYTGISSPEYFDHGSMGIEGFDPLCVWRRPERYGYWYNYASITQSNLRLMDQATSDFFGGNVQGVGASYEVYRVYDGKHVFDNVFGANASCETARDIVLALPQWGAPDKISYPIAYSPDSRWQYGSGSISTHVTGFYDWVYHQSTAYQIDMLGGVVGGISTGPYIQYNSRSNGYDEAGSDYNRTLWGGSTLAHYGVNSVSYSDQKTWIEGANVDGVFYEYRSGAGLYDSGDVPDLIDSSDGHVHPRYWGQSEVGSPIFMSSGWRYDGSGWVYFHVKPSGAGLTGTEFPFTHSLGGFDFHSIPGFDDKWGKGYFRLIKVDHVIDGFYERESFVK